MEKAKFIIVCPNCKKEISVDEALEKEMESSFLKKAEADFLQKEEKIKKEAWVKAQAIAKEKEEQKVKLLEDQLEEQRKKRLEAEEAELKIRKEKIQFDEEKKAFELEKQRQIDEERKKIKEETAKTILEEHRLKDAEKDKLVSDMRRQIEELRRKSEQGSQQTQGEVLELELEEKLKTTFSVDEIMPVPKGINGADIIQQVRDKLGRSCGLIVWELKRTKAWSEGWVQKLKDDQRSCKADIAILVSQVLPEGVKNFGFRDGVYVATFEFALNLAKVLRFHIIELAGSKLLEEGKSEKKEVIYNYLCGPEFRGRVEAVVESFVSMKDSLDREKRAFTKIWAEREKQIERAQSNMIGMYGDMQGIASIPAIKSLELPSGEEELEAVVAEAEEDEEAIELRGKLEPETKESDINKNNKMIEKNDKQEGVAPSLF